MRKNPCVYIMANKENGTLYTGVTSSLEKRVDEHKSEVYKGFTQKYHLHLLVWYEMQDTMESAIMREKQIKAGSLKKENCSYRRAKPFLERFVLGFLRCSYNVMDCFVVPPRE